MLIDMIEHIVRDAELNGMKVLSIELDELHFSRIKNEINKVVAWHYTMADNVRFTYKGIPLIFTNNNNYLTIKLKNNEITTS